MDEPPDHSDSFTKMTPEPTQPPDLSQSSAKQEPADTQQTPGVEQMPDHLQSIDSSLKRKRSKTDVGIKSEPEDLPLFVREDSEDSSYEMQGKRLKQEPEETRRKSDHNKEDDYSDSDDEDDEDDEDSDDESDAEFNIDPENVLHTESQEDYPPYAAYHKDLPGLQEKLQATVQGASAILSSSDCDSRAVENLLAQSRETESTRLPDPIKIALLGDAGTGKSSFLNGLLDIPRLAKEGDTGTSCTCVVTEYHAKLPNQTKKFAATIQYFDEEKIADLLREHLECYKVFHFEKDSSWSQKEKSEHQIWATTSMDTFYALFCDQEEFSSPGAATRYLRAQYNDDAWDGVIDQFLEWCNDMLEEKEVDDDGCVDVIEADTTRDLRQSLDGLLSTSAAQRGQPSLWPLVKKVSVGIDGPRVLKNSSIADLPGISDTNQVRVRASNDYLRECNYLCIVVPISRAITDDTVEDLFQRYEDMFKGRIMVICTSSDLTSDHDKLAMSYKDLGQNINPYLELKKHIKPITKEIKSLMTKYKNNKTRGAIKANIGRKIDDLKTQKMQLMLEKFECVIDIRNHYVVDGIQTSKAKYMPPGQPLDVHCVSNTNYNRLQGLNFGSELYLSVEGTGIPGVRAHILSLSAPSLWNAIKSHVNGPHTIFLNRLATWATHTHVTDRAGLMDIVTKPKTLDVIMEDYATSLQEKVDEQITQPIDIALPEMTKYALEKISKWWQLHWCTIRAFIRYNGNHGTSILPPTSWNKEMFEKGWNIINDEWAVLCETELKLRGRLKENILNSLDETPKQLAAHGESIFLPGEKLEELFEAEKTIVEAAFERFDTAYSHRIGVIKDDATKNFTDGYFAKAMSEAYRSGQRTSGTGFKARCRAIFEVHVSLQGARSPFCMAAESTASAIKENAESCTRELCAAVKAVYKSREEQFSAMLDEEPEEDPETQTMRDQMKVYLEEARPKFDKIKAGLIHIEATTRG